MAREQVGGAGRCGPGRARGRCASGRPDRPPRPSRSHLPRRPARTPCRRRRDRHLPGRHLRRCGLRAADPEPDRVDDGRRRHPRDPGSHLRAHERDGARPPPRDLARGAVQGTRQLRPTRPDLARLGPPPDHRRRPQDRGGRAAAGRGAAAPGVPARGVRPSVGRPDPPPARGRVARRPGLRRLADPGRFLPAAVRPGRDLRRGPARQPLLRPPGSVGALPARRRAAHHRRHRRLRLRSRPAGGLAGRPAGGRPPADGLGQGLLPRVHPGRLAVTTGAARRGAAVHARPAALPRAACRSRARPTPRSASTGPRPDPCSHCRQASPRTSTSPGATFLVRSDRVGGAVRVSGITGSDLDAVRDLYLGAAQREGWTRDQQCGCGAPRRGHLGGRWLRRAAGPCATRSGVPARWSSRSSPGSSD